MECPANCSLSCPQSCLFFQNRETTISIKRHSLCHDETHSIFSLGNHPVCRLCTIRLLLVLRRQCLTQLDTTSSVALIQLPSEKSIKAVVLHATIIPGCTLHKPLPLMERTHCPGASFFFCGTGAALLLGAMCLLPWERPYPLQCQDHFFASSTTYGHYVCLLSSVIASSTPHITGKLQCPFSPDGGLQDSSELVHSTLSSGSSGKFFIL